ncbi:MAG: radical SAM protein [Candidatus Improbicoccus pseudotrichonymphae]|uniref:Radical SAM protein n=1 Tax=Candidatus Improbicoccus pseudotrichonymphae TaxID=3033792 RepID=A0AA48I2N1_9FIRM|nr:MAG: radical SAM protein [Candidatus Improbicoccus pseudotrichonymphae]
MKYAIDEKYELRSWKNNKCLINLQTGENEKIQDVVFQTLTFCVNNIDFNSVFVLNQHREILNKLIKNKIVYPSLKNKISNYCQKYKNYDCNFIDMVHWSITKNCNLRCKHCYMNASKKTANDDITFEECKKIIFQIAQCGIKKISITGGEPFVRPDFWEIVDEIIRNDIRIKKIYTNGFNLNENIIKNLKLRNIYPEFSLSFDGCGYHDWLRGIKGTEKKVIESIKLLHKNGFKISCEVCIHRINAGAIKKTIDFLKNLGVTYIKVNKAVNTGNWVNYSEKYGISNKEIYDLFIEYIPYFLKKGTGINLQLGGVFYYDTNNRTISVPLIKKIKENSYVCEHAKNILYLNSRGEVLPCSILDSNKFEYKSKIHNNLKDILNNSTYSQVSNLTVKEFMDKNPKCFICKNRNLCNGGCRASAIFEGGNYLSHDPQMCSFFEGEYLAKIEKIIRSKSLSFLTRGVF